MLNLLGPYKYVVDVLVVLTLVAAAAFAVHEYNARQQGIGEARIQAQWDREKAEQDRQSAELKAQNDAVTQTLQETIAAQRSQANAQIAVLNSTVTATIAGLRERPSRDSSGGVPRDPTTGAALGGTGAGLLRQDAEFLIGEAAAANRLKFLLAQCQQQYNAARKTLTP